MEPNQKSVILPILIIILVIVIIVCGVYVYSEGKNSAPTQTTHTSTTTVETTPSQATSTDPVVQWLTYADPSAGFSFMYPSDWTLNDKTLNEVSVKPQNATAAHLTITAAHDSLQNTKNSLRVFNTSGYIVNSQENVTVNGQVWQKYVVNNDQVYLLAYINNWTYVIHYPTAVEANEPINQMISSLRFGSSAATASSTVQGS